MPTPGSHQAATPAALRLPTTMAERSADLSLTARSSILKEISPVRSQAWPEPEPSPTEMVKRLLEKGWFAKLYPNGMMYWIPNDESHCAEYLLGNAYRKAFPSKKKIEIEVWTKNGKVRNILKEDVPYLEGWTKGIATFWVEEEQPCTSEDGSS